jgi:DNA repair protein RadA
MEEIPDITSDTIVKLKKININSVYQLAVQNPFELALEYEDTSVSVETASTLIANARKILIDNDVLTNEFSTAMNFWKSAINYLVMPLDLKASTVF